MKKFALISLGLLAVSSAFAQRIVIYATGRTIADQKIALKAWGSGTIAETDETAYEGTTSVRVSTRNYFQGGRIILQPTDLASATENKDNLLMFTVKLNAEQASGGGNPGGGRTTGDGGEEGARGGGRPGRGGGGGVGDPSGGGPRGGGGQSGGGTSEPQGKNATLKSIRVVITTTDGLKSEMFVAVPNNPNKDGWRQFALPLQAIAGFTRTNKVIKEIALAGDATGTFWVGEIRVANDSTPIQGDVNIREINIGLGEELELIGTGFAGSTALRYTWDFDSANGIQEEAEGAYIRRRFRKAGTYTVTLTIHDQYGLKKPYSTTLTVVVNP